MALVKYIEANGAEHEVEVKSGKTVMQGAVDNMIDGIVAECGGHCSCATCHCIIDDAWADQVGEPGEAEDELLDCVPKRHTNSRLSCQITVSDELDGLVVSLPESQF